MLGLTIVHLAKFKIAMFCPDVESACKVALLLTLKGLCHLAFLTRFVSWLAFVIAIFMALENGDNQGKPGDGNCRACWTKETL